MRGWFKENPEYVIVLAILASILLLVLLGVKEAGIAGITGILGFLKQKDKNDTVIEEKKAEYEEEKEITDRGCSDEQKEAIEAINALSIDELVILGNSIIQSRSGDQGK